MQTEKVGVLVLCRENSCRSQMLAAYLESYAGHRLRVYTAGTDPAEDVHPLTRIVLREDGLEIGDRLPVDHRELLGHIPVYYLIIACDSTALECPSIWPGAMERLVWPFEDPVREDGSYEEKLARFRSVRDQIRGQVEGWVRREILRR